MNMGHHGVYGKGNATYPMNMYEESVKVPFIMSHTGALRRGVVCDSLLSHYDFLPTVLEYLGLPGLPEAEAQTLPVLRIFVLTESQSPVDEGMHCWCH